MLWSFNKNLVWMLIYMFPIRVQFSICCSGRYPSAECQDVDKSKQFCCFAAGTHQGKLIPYKTHPAPASLSQRRWPLVSLCEPQCQRARGRKRFMTMRKDKWLEYGSFNALFPFSSLLQFQPLFLSLFQQMIWKYMAFMQSYWANSSRRKFPSQFLQHFSYGISLPTIYWSWPKLANESFPSAFGLQVVE